jgi:class 3 adenylate cyclase
MGLHAADAVRRGTDYSGVGVHVAARVAELAGPGEILATVETIAEAGLPRPGETREAHLKGISGAVAIGSLPWT